MSPQPDSSPGRIRASDSHRAIVVAAISIVLASPTVARAQVSKPAWHLSAIEVASSCRSAVANTKAKIDALLARPAASQTFANTLRPVEEAWDDFANATSALGFLMSVSSDKAVRDSSAACNQVMTNYGVELDADPRLYAASVRAQKEKLSAVDQQLAARYVEITRHSGGALDPATRVRTTAMLQHVSDIGRDFILALGADSASIAISDSDAAPLPAQFKATLKRAGAEWIVPVNESTVGTFMRNEPSSSARRRYYGAYMRRGGAPNIERLRSAIALRDTIAHLFGFPTWAAYQLDVRMAKSPARAVDFLHRIDAGLLPKAKEEVTRLEPLAETDRLGHPVAVWDVSYYSEKLRRAKYALNAEEVRQYFPVDHVVRAVLDIYQELFGLTFTEVKPADVWSPDVQQYTVRDAATHRELGTAYLDLFPRPDKYDHFADFGLVYARRRGSGDRELPVTAIVGNWPAPGGGQPSLLSHGDVETFFHEFGHAVAALADESPYLTTGTGNLRQDFVEALSQMLENWMWQPSILKRVSHHVTTGRPLPDSLIARMIALKHFRDGSNGTAQAFYASYDMTLHSSGADVDPLGVWTKMYGEMTALPDIEGTMGPASFGHLMGGYDAGYYGYLWSKVYAQDLFTRFEKNGVMDAATGRAYRKVVLAPGATEEPDVLLQRFLGRPLRYDAFFKEMGIGATSTH
jgi:thimet oligopeptidase